MIDNGEFLTLIVNKNYDKIKELASKGEINFKEIEQTILKDIVSKCPDEVVYILLDNNVNLGIQDKQNKQTPFMLLCRNENISLDCFKRVLENINVKNTINIQDSYGQTALYHLIKHILFYITNIETKQTFIDRIKLLIENGADIFIEDSTIGINSFMLLCSIKEIDKNYIESLIKNNKKILEKKDKQNETVLHKCATSANLEVIKLLIENELDITAKNTDKTTPLMLLCKNKDITVDFLEDLFKKYPKAIKNINKIDKKGKNALHYAADGCNIAIMDFLAQKGVDATTVMSEGTPLMLLVKNIKASKIELTDEFINKFTKLIENKNIQKSINTTNNEGKNVLHVNLEEYGNIQIINILINNGANIKQKDTNKVTPFMLLCKRNDIDAKYLEELINKNNITKKDINKKDNYKDTVLFNIINNKNKDKQNILKLLIDKGADINIKNKDGKTVLDIVKEKNDTKLIEFFDSIKNNPHKHHKDTTISNSVQINDSKNKKHITSVSSAEERLPDLKPAVEKTATSFISKTQGDIYNEKQKKTNITKNIYNDIKQENIDIHKQQEVTTQDTQKEKQDNIQITNKEENNNKTKESGSQNATKTNITNNTVQVSESPLQNNNKDDIMLMFCLMFVMLNIKNKYLNKYLSNSYIAF